MDDDFALKPGMLLGTASSATQQDGGEADTTWRAWCEKGRARDGSDPSRAALHYERWREDTLLMHRLGIQTSRLSVEWARIEPEEGVFDELEIARVKEELMLLIGMGVKPLVTLHHFSDPMWFAAKGGWLVTENVRCFLIYVERVIKSIGHLVSEYITVNEPNLYAYNGYVSGKWPPGEKKPSLAFTVLSNMAGAHIKSYRLIHDMRRSMGFHDTRVSFSLHMCVFVPKNANPVYQRGASERERLFQIRPALAMMTGQFRRPYRNLGRDRQGNYSDFHAIDYFTRKTVDIHSGTDPKGFKSDLGWEIYPKGITACCESLMRIQPKPIYITGCGVCDLSDAFRSRFIYEHLRELCRSNLPVKRFYYQSFLDGFEWSEGSYARFGLVSADGESARRTVKQSGEFYSQLIRAGRVTQELYDRFVSGEDYHY